MEPGFPEEGSLNEFLENECFFFARTITGMPRVVGFVLERHLIRELCLPPRL